MNTREHILAIVEPTEADQTSIDITRGVVANGGTATVILLISGQVLKDISEFAKSEGLDRPTAEAIATQRISQRYAARIGGSDTETILADSNTTVDAVLAHSTRINATSIVVSPNALGRHGLQQLTARANVPVVFAPRPAA